MEPAEPVTPLETRTGELEPLAPNIVERRAPAEEHLGAFLPSAQRYGPLPESRAYQPYAAGPYSVKPYTDPRRRRRAPPMESTLRIVGLAIVVVLIIVIVYYYLWAPRTLSKDLARCGWVLFTRQGCGYCTRQLQILGDPFYSKMVVCSGSDPLEQSSSVNPNVLDISCAQVPAYPYWYNTTTKDARIGLQRHRELEQMAGW